MKPPTRYRPRNGPPASTLRQAAALLLLGLLAACAATPGPIMPVAQEAADYRAHARAYYAPPGPPDDPWGPYIEAAAARFDVPDAWIRAVMHQESGGHEFIDGQFVTSVPGAMGLMQLMPPTYDDMRSQYGLGADAYEPHDNIMAGTAYIRQMYDTYGSPGFLAAYNTGPGRLDDFLTRNRPLPHETRQYVSIIGPQIAGIYPNSRSQTDLMVMHQSGAEVAAASQDAGQTRSVRLAWARRGDHGAGDDQPVQVAEAPVTASAAAPAYPGWTPVRPRAAPSTPHDAGVGAVWAARLAAAPVPAAGHPAAVPPSAVASRTPSRAPARLRLIEPAMAEPAPPLRTPHDDPRDDPRDWAVQVGAFGSVGQASEAVGSAKSRVRALLPDARTEIAGIRAGKGGARVYRARLTGLSRLDAVQACRRLSHGRSECMVVSPDSRS